MFDIKVEDAQFELVSKQLAAYPRDIVVPAGRRALPKIGQNILAVEKETGPASKVHRGPATNPYGPRSKTKGTFAKKKTGPALRLEHPVVDTWRSPTDHARDLLYVSKVREDSETRMPYVVVGPIRGDTGSTFYLKFFEYGAAHMKNKGGKSFVRPARDRIMNDPSTSRIVIDEFNKEMEKQYRRDVSEAAYNRALGR